jgi:hypothetical protein
MPIAWAGVKFTTAEQWKPADLSGGTELVFSSRGDDKTYAVLLFTEKGGRVPSRRTFVAGQKWTQHRIPFADFDGTDGSDVVAIVFVAGPAPGKFSFQLDDVSFR